MPQSHVMDDIFGQVRDAADGRDRFAVQDLLDAFGRRGHGPLILVAGLTQLTPLGAVPGANDVLATIQLLLALHYAFASGPPWLPSWIARRDVDASKVRDALDRAQPYARCVQFLFRERLVWLTDPPWSYGAALTLAALAVSMYALSFVPGAVAAPGLLTVLIALAIIARDGLMLAAATALSLALVIGSGGLAF